MCILLTAMAGEQKMSRLLNTELFAWRQHYLSQRALGLIIARDRQSNYPSAQLPQVGRMKDRIPENLMFSLYMYFFDVS